VPGRGHRAVGAPAGQDPAFDRESLVDLVLALDDPLEHLLELARLRLRKKADLAEVDADERHVDVGDRAGGSQKRPIAAQHDERIGRRQLAHEGLGLTRGRLPFADPAQLAPTGRPRTQLDGRLDRGVVGEPDPGDGHRLVAFAMSSPISAQPGPGAR
jgi:hypothetical protein